MRVAGRAHVDELHVVAVDAARASRFRHAAEPERCAAASVAARSRPHSAASRGRSGRSNACGAVAPGLGVRRAHERVADHPDTSVRRVLPARSADIRIPVRRQRRPGCRRWTRRARTYAAVTGRAATASIMLQHVQRQLAGRPVRPSRARMAAGHVQHAAGRGPPPPRPTGSRLPVVAAGRRGPGCRRRTGWGRAATRVASVPVISTKPVPAQRRVEAEQQRGGRPRRRTRPARATWVGTSTVERGPGPRPGADDPGGRRRAGRPRRPASAGPNSVASVRQVVRPQVEQRARRPRRNRNSGSWCQRSGPGLLHQGQRGLRRRRSRPPAISRRAVCRPAPSTVSGAQPTRTPARGRRGEQAAPGRGVRGQRFLVPDVLARRDRGRAPPRRARRGWSG